MLATLGVAACLNSPSETEEIAEGQGVFGEWVFSGGFQRTYVLHQPVGVDAGTPVPLLVFYHGRASTGAAFQGITGLDSIADREGFAVVYPDGVGEEQEWAIGSGLTTPDRLGVNDVLFTLTLIEHLAQTLRIDRDRVYIAGFSQGGMMTQTLACAISDRVAAVLTVGATPFPDFAADCGNTRDLPMVFVIGTEDPSFPWDGSRFTMSIPETLQFWSTRMGCDARPTAEDLPNVVDDGTSVTRETYPNCSNNSELVYYRVSGGGHTWPGASTDFGGAFGPHNRDISASEIITEFMLRHSLN